MRCPVCKDKESTFVVTEHGNSHTSKFGVGRFECSNCSFIFSDYVAPEVLLMVYTYMFRGTTPHIIDDLRDLTRANGKSQLITMQPHLPNRLGRVLDFGGGLGEAAKLYLPFSEAVYIVEKDPAALACIREIPELEILEEEDLLKDKYVGFFDLVIFSNVLEHMPFPLQQIQKFSRMIAEGGFLFVEVPCEADLFKKTNVAPPLHLGFYTLHSFIKLVEEQGSFEIIDIRRCGASTEKIIERGWFHDTESQNTEDGYEIRALLKNVRPNQKSIEYEYDEEEGDGILENLSEYLLHFTSFRSGESIE